MQTNSVGGSQLAALLQQLQQKTQTSFSAADADGDGKLSKTEFSAFGAALKAGTPQSANGAGKALPTADQIFSKLDDDGDGSVTLAEIQNHAPPSLSSDGLSALLKLQEANGSNADPKVAAAFKAADTDGDGKLSKTEFTAFDTAIKADGHGGAGRAHGGGGGGKTPQVFDALDTNQDGTVSAEELAAGTPPPPLPDGTASSTNDGTSKDLLSGLIQQLVANYKQNSGADIASALTGASAVSV